MSKRAKKFLEGELSFEGLTAGVDVTNFNVPRLVKLKINSFPGINNIRSKDQPNERFVAFTFEGEEFSIEVLSDQTSNLVSDLALIEVSSGDTIDIRSNLEDKKPKEVGHAGRSLVQDNILR